MLGKSGAVFTIITATYNADNFFEKLALSIAEQTFKKIEWLVIDGGSKDATIDLIKKYEHLINYWISEPDKGIYDAWNKALNKSNGDWIIFLGADDCFFDHTSLEQVFNEVTKVDHSNLILYSKVLQYGLSNKQTQILGSDWIHAKKVFNSVMSIPHPGVFYRADIFKIYGTFDTRFKIAGDYEFLMRTTNQNLYPHFINKIFIRMGGGGISSLPQHAIRSLDEALLARKILHIRPLYPAAWCLAYAKAFVKLLIFKIFGGYILNKAVNFYRLLTGRPLR